MTRLLVRHTKWLREQGLINLIDTRRPYPGAQDHQDIRIAAADRHHQQVAMLD